MVKVEGLQRRTMLELGVARGLSVLFIACDRAKTM